ncbi:MAG: protein phosphatase 2C domain-containing protein [Acidimicrobiia bacterium]|nr:protein phosphatase 2C domain-containing protein [Acidimicrobiia bacterium]MDH4363912.1 protein phosphatase 2C domain-containing protein [Acidimicrobiia bacterium]
MTGLDLIQCPVCHEPAPSAAKFCEACGTELTGVAPLARPVGSPSPAGPSLVCVACGEAAVTDDGYCGSCGHKQPGPRDHLEMAAGVAVAITDRGVRHHDNEDAVAIGELPGGGAVIVVCDGVSSTPGSAQASQAAADAARDLLVEHLGTGPLDGVPFEPGRVDDALVAAAALAQERAAAVPPPDVSESPFHGGPPSSTFVAAVARLVNGEAQLDVAWVGDSRAYWLVGGEAVRLTEDHELGGSLSRWLGADSIDPTPEITRLVATAPGRLLVCSDGLWRYAEPAPAMADLVARFETEVASRRDLAAALVDHAIAGGGHDNITVALWSSAEALIEGPAAMVSAARETATTGQMIGGSEQA